MNLPRYTGPDARVREWTQRLIAVLERPPIAPSGTGDPIPERQRPGKVPAQYLTLTASLALDWGLLDTRYVVSHNQAGGINFDLPNMSEGDWVQVVNDLGSAGNIVVRDSALATITTVTPGGDSGEIIADVSGTPVPV